MNRVSSMGMPKAGLLWLRCAAHVALTLLVATPSHSSDLVSQLGDTGGVVFASERDGTPTDIYLVDALGDSVHRVTNHDRADDYLVGPRWMSPGSSEIFGFFPIPMKSADGEVIGYKKAGLSLEMTSVVHTRNKPEQDARTSLSHTIPAIDAFQLNEGEGLNIFFSERGAKDTTRLTDRANSFHPVWSPDSQTIAFLSDRFGEVEIFSIDRHGQDLVRLAPGHLAHRPVWAWPHGHQAIDRAQAGHLAFLGGTPKGPLDVYVVHRDGSGLTNVSKDSVGVDAFCWSWDGRQIAFSSRRDGNREIYVVNIDGLGLRNVTNHPADDLHFSWVDSHTANALLEAAAPTEEELRVGIDFLRRR